ncbi:MAG: laccase domain protein [marine bacterium B5-7]|nr:MAG: laccase domain protein [marine bacterium B5-7]
MTNTPGPYSPSASTLPCITSRLLESGRVAHGFFTREGGKSDGLYASLNASYGSNDDATLVSDNRTRVATRFKIDATQLYTLKQVHGTDVVHADLKTPARTTPGDALVCATPGILIGILAADCVPLLLVDQDAGVVGAAHAGWRGAATGVVEAVVTAMEERGAIRSRIRAAIGPAISSSSYEVGEDLITEVNKLVSFDCSFLINRQDSKTWFDLPGLVRSQCLQSDITLIDQLAHDTYADEERFFSYRRAVHRAEPDYGRQLSVIGLRLPSI